MIDGASKGQQQQARKDELQEMLDRARSVARRHATAAATAERRDEAPSATQFANIASNTFYKIMLDGEADPKAKMEACARALAYAEDKDQSRERLEEFKAFKEYLQFER
jgi:negative regulator of genetic competence, sporulation and motility